MCQRNASCMCMFPCKHCSLLSRVAQPQPGYVDRFRQNTTKNLKVRAKMPTHKNSCSGCQPTRTFAWLYSTYEWMPEHYTVWGQQHVAGENKCELNETKCSNSAKVPTDAQKNAWSFCSAKFTRLLEKKNKIFRENSKIDTVKEKKREWECVRARARASRQRIMPESPLIACKVPKSKALALTPWLWCLLCAHSLHFETILILFIIITNNSHAQNAHCNTVRQFGLWLSKSIVSVGHQSLFTHHCGCRNHSAQHLVDWRKVPAGGMLPKSRPSPQWGHLPLTPLQHLQNIREPNRHLKMSAKTSSPAEMNYHHKAY